MFLTTADGLINSIFKSSADAEYFWRIHYTTVNLFSLLTNTKIFFGKSVCMSFESSKCSTLIKNVGKRMVFHFITIPYTEIYVQFYKSIMNNNLHIFHKTEMDFFCNLASECSQNGKLSFYRSQRTTTTR